MRRLYRICISCTTSYTGGKTSYTYKLVMRTAPVSVDAPLYHFVDTASCSFRLLPNSTQIENNWFRGGFIARGPDHLQALIVHS